ncbi:hypothetical protein CesoFtcFv8_015144 [Champsocephalus esox]|uniref:Uncharacterized protein n=1 Tax=Champsocephalus esox TaxID=159716 RepID=A0AAN8BQX7_9TELE|nr:hypothetical protein CesoFtcFv8_015144 [Champsocephalus esox]
MGPPLSDTVELASFHSASKGFMGECGLRGGYVELVNLDPDVMKCIYKLFSTDTCAPVLSQIALDLMTDPPQPGDPLYPLYSEETQHIKTMMVHNVKRVFEVLNSLPGFSCKPVEGGGFAFPRLHLPPKAIQKAMVIYLLDGLVLIPRLVDFLPLTLSLCRFCIMNPEDTMEEMLSRLSSFHTQFMKDFS